LRLKGKHFEQALLVLQLTPQFPRPS